MEDFLDRLSDRQVKKITWVLRVVRDIDPVPPQYFTKLPGTDDIWEVRIRVGSDIFRFLGFHHGPDRITLTNPFQKKTEKTPRREIRPAEKRKREYLGRRRK